MATGSPGKRRGARGPNARGVAKAKAKGRVLDQRVSLALAATAEERVARRAKQVEDAMADCRLTNRGARSIAEESLVAMLELRDLLRERAEAGTITSEEGAVANAVQRNILKWIMTMGVERLRDHDDCPVCDGRGRVDGEDCEACDGTGVAE